MIHKWERMIFYYRDLLRDEFLDISEVCLLLGITEGECVPLSSCATRTTDAMDIGFRNIRDLVVDHVLERVDIDTTSRDIRSDEDASSSCLEVHESFLSRGLRLVPVDSLSRYTIFSEDLHDFIGSTFCPSKYKNGFDGLFLEKFEKKMWLISFIDEINTLFDDIDGRRDRCDGHFRRIDEDRARELHDLGRHSCREKECLLLRREDSEELLHIMDESHIEHTICLIEDEELDIAEGYMFLIHEVKEASWCRDEDIDSISESIYLCSLSDTTEYDGRAEACMSSVCLEALTDLDSELTSGSDYECTDMPLWDEWFFLSLFRV